MRIDSHTHGEPTCFDGDPTAYVEACRARGIEAIVLIEPVDRCLAAVDRFGDFIIPVAMIHMDVATPHEVEACIQAGCQGIKFIAPAAPYGDERYWPLYGALEALGAPAVFHTGYLAFSPEATGENPAHPVSMEHMRAAQIERISRRFPDLGILMAHYSNPWWEEAWKVSWTKPTIYADLSGGTAIRRSIRMWADLLAPDGELFEPSVRALCFGSDVPYFLPDQYPFERYVTFYERIFDAIGLSPELREQVNRDNVRALFHLDG